ncbi:hypothetical protein [Psychrobium sp. 1_MG-2023]|uniref:hypothetical protein n=1 Tax=Psychrobium sp. 1_MG-2023 TaxID=3062624 RepID=UPI000C323BED|nr:hypothetical protein [Psychrobium sp. 1_MG-2023]MDP2559791.1 hypothetical protein [Psychrobium sp. 1_MG-2023]PKF59101.1 hypothetical protein CW748_02630 [Alteromonadales bacterium alter-6D02]
MHQEFHARDWIALVNKVLHQTGHSRSHIKKVLKVTDSEVVFLTCKGATIVAPTFNSIHGHGIGFLSLLRVANSSHQPQWNAETGEPEHHCQLLVKNHHNFTPLLYPSIRQVNHWLARQYGDKGGLHRAPFEDDIDKGYIGRYPAIVDIQRQLSYPVV